MLSRKLRNNYFMTVFHVNRFWNLLKDWLKNNCDHCHRLVDLDYELIILFGVCKDFSSHLVFDMIVQMAKKFIYRCKCLNKPLDFNIFKKEVKKRYEIEKYI